MKHDLYSDDPLERLNASRNLPANEHNEIVRSLSVGCPRSSWPFGMPTSINPWIAMLGPSPGGSPSKDDPWVRNGPLLPTTGVPHQGLFYPDGRRFWDKVRNLGRTSLKTLNVKGTEDQDTLTGVMNLDDGQSGDARRIALQAPMVTWVLQCLFERLRPQVVVALGLKGRLRDDPFLRQQFAAFVPALADRRLMRSEVIQLSSGRSLNFEFAPTVAGQIFVQWPQHPSRAPFSSIAYWKEACEEFAETLLPRHLK